ncbi:Protein-glutamate methylesterase/protein-glutamine glutaminase 3 [Rhodovastum atsumiense]|uniref:Protein-glutamate methylesterase/protein-glutamine glutaminase n=1 Tax=Rhodovastum atsumiense TaxID=504468 RepID=A0A5M6IPA6_9PROT|nr:chemotaxis-specific protein-glutamate methyltransferase CheB [Rhodovastum atsumiense]KAA5610100.1 chemotaxis-specific protein-glutamate methyltransferase CheB [Rhodovastum atsumiense]CAH2601428.1 Protein-glutamate methylesterase/protein-glutamine glutaminase 3 [Rhodovastum atsumiense]
MPGSPLRVLVVDDSALMRRQLRQMLESAGDVVVQHARNGHEALEQIRVFNPQVVTLDVNMPEMDGLTCLRRLMREAPRPVVMVSSLTADGAEVTVRALALGAVDVVLKPDGTVSSGIDRVRTELLAKVRTAARARLRPMRLEESLRAERTAVSARHRAALQSPRDLAGVVLIGVSTGGPRALEDILPDLPEGFPYAVVIAQHMPASFTGSLARRMDGLCVLPVQEVAAPTPLRGGAIFIGRGESDVVIERRLGRIVANAVPPDQSPWHPSADRMVASAMEHLPPARLIGVLLTGMGNDGAEAMTALHRRGGRTIAESEQTAAVFGMPAELIRRGGATEVLACDRIAAHLAQWMRM